MYDAENQYQIFQRDLYGIYIKSLYLYFCHSLIHLIKIILCFYFSLKYITLDCSFSYIVWLMIYSVIMVYFNSTYVTNIQNYDSYYYDNYNNRITKFLGVYTLYSSWLIYGIVLIKQSQFKNSDCSHFITPILCIIIFDGITSLILLVIYLSLHTRYCTKYIKILIHCGIINIIFAHHNIISRYVLINNLPTCNYHRETFPDVTECSICQNEYEPNQKVKKFTCNHIFHENCIDIWLNKNSTCPLCRKYIINIYDEERQNMINSFALGYATN